MPDTKEQSTIAPQQQSTPPAATSDASTTNVNPPANRSDREHEPGASPTVTMPKPPIVPVIGSSSGTPASNHPVSSPTSTAAPQASGGSGTSGKRPGPKPHNVFSNDGSFLERFQRLKREEEEQKKQKELLERKKYFADRFKSRGKRDHSEVSDSGEVSSSSASASGSSSSQTPEIPSKKAKSDESRSGSSSSSANGKAPLNDYQREMQNVNTSSSDLKGSGAGVRPLIK